MVFGCAPTYAGGIDIAACLMEMQIRGAWFGKHGTIVGCPDLARGTEFRGVLGVLEEKDKENHGESFANRQK